MRKHYYLLICVVSFFACQQSNESATNPVYQNDYTFSKIGQFIEYDVQEIQYSLSATPIKSSYQWKEKVIALEKDISNEDQLRIIRYRRANENTNWQIDSVLFVKNSIDKSIKNEGNTLFVKLTYPLKENQRWDGNLYNNYGKDDYVMKKVNQPYTFNQQVFSNTVLVEQQNDSSLVDLKKRIEVYAKGIGMIYSESSNLAYCSTPACLGKASIDYGKRKFITLRTYGIEN